MEKDPIALVLSDVDGTLIPEGAEELPSGMETVIRSLRDRGLPFGVVSGRSFQELRALFGTMSEGMYFGCEGGSLLYDGAGTLLHVFVLDPQTVETLAAHTAAYPEAELWLHTPAGVQQFEDGDLPTNVYKAAVRCPGGVSGYLQHLEGRWTPDCSVAVADGQWMECSGAGKGACVQYLLSVLRIAPEQVLYFGDSYSDWEVLELVGHPWIRDSAPSALRIRFRNQTADVVKTLRRQFTIDGETT